MILCRRLAVAFLSAIAFLFCSTLLGGETPCGDIWLVSTRAASRCGPAALTSQPIHYWQLDAHCGWQRASLSAFEAASTESPLPTYLFIHGDRCDADDALRAAAPVRAALVAGGRPFRLVIWSWPSNRVDRSARVDAQLKESYTPRQSHYLAEFLAHVDPRADVNLVGFSFGARIAAGALHLLGGGTVAGRALDGPAARPASLRALFVAAAFESNGLSPRGRFCQALTVADEILVIRNTCDRALRFYPRLHGRGGPDALGYVGPTGCHSPKLKIADVTNSVGKAHAWFRYAARIGLAGLLN